MQQLNTCHTRGSNWYHSLTAFNCIHSQRQPPGFAAKYTPSIAVNKSVADEARRFSNGTSFMF